MSRTGAALACLSALVWTGLAAGQKIELSAHELSGADEPILRMAGQFKPIELAVSAKVRPYDLPVDLDRLANRNFRINLLPFRNKLTAEAGEKLLKQNGFVVFADKAHDDVVRFYAAVQSANVPIFVTSGSVLHLYHVQFDETLRDIEERQLAADVVAMCQTIQAEAVKVHDAAKGEVKEAAALLAGYAAVPAALLAQKGLSSEAAAAVQELSGWAEKPDWRKREEFVEKYAEVLAVLTKEQGLVSQKYGMDAEEVRKALRKYLAAHPVTAEEKDKLIPAFVAEEVKKELDLIAAAAGPAESPLFKYKEDYSQYVPRGHYARGGKLKPYFRAMTWLGRMTFLVRGQSSGVEGLVPLAEAQRQTRAACLLAGMMDRKCPDGRTLAEVWDRLYAVTAFYAGTPDDLTVHDYRKAMLQTLGANPTAEMLAEQVKLFDVRAALSKMRRPAIYSGLGQMELPPVTIADEKDLAKALAATQGLRLLGQRYVPDSYVMGQLVYPTVGAFNGQGEPFTLAKTAGGPVRAFPRGLDVMAALGSERSRHWLTSLGDDAYDRYHDVLRELQAELKDLPAADWNRNLYWAWLGALRPLLVQPGEGYPAFMRTEAWADKQLSTALASWSQLRHDTILYAKPSYTPAAGNGHSAPEPKMVEGYVEPVPELFARLLEVTKLTRRGLEAMKLLDAPAMARVQAMEAILDRLQSISLKELADQKLAADDYAFIREFAQRLAVAAAGTDRAGLETTIVADVHTDANSGRALTEATGPLHMMVVIYPMPDGGLVAGVGAVLSHYEFLQPMKARLTDAAWRKMLAAAQVPPLPAWSRGFTVGK